MKNKLVSLVLVSMSSWYCFAAQPLRITRINQQPATCITDDRPFELGSISLTIAGGTPPYFYTVNSGPRISVPLGDTVIVHNDVPGQYTFAVADSAMPPVTTGAIVQIAAPHPVVITAVDVVNNVCSLFPGDTPPGSITVTSVGGLAPVEFRLDEGDFTVANTFSGLGPDIYEITARSADLCPTTAIGVEVTGVPDLTFSASSRQVTCNGGSDGAIFVQALGGAQPFQYSINGGVTFQDSPLFEDLLPGMYNIVIQDVNGCRYSIDDPLIITQPEGFVIESVTALDPSPRGARNGSIRVTTNFEGPGIVYTLNGGSPQASPLFSNLPAGTYTVLAAIGSVCAQRTVTLGAFDFTTTIITDPSCPTGPLGSLRITATGGVPPYQYSIDSGETFQSSPVFTDLVAGRYTVVVRDSTRRTVTHLVDLGTIIPPTSDPLVNFIIGKYCTRCISIVEE